MLNKSMCIGLLNLLFCNPCSKIFESLRTFNRSWLSLSLLKCVYGEWQHGRKNEKESDRHKMVCTQSGGGNGFGVYVYPQPHRCPWAHL